MDRGTWTAQHLSYLAKGASCIRTSIGESRPIINGIEQKVEGSTVVHKSASLLEWWKGTGEWFNIKPDASGTLYVLSSNELPNYKNENGFTALSDAIPTEFGGQDLRNTDYSTVITSKEMYVTVVQWKNDSINGAQFNEDGSITANHPYTNRCLYAYKMAFDANKNIVLPVPGVAAADAPFFLIKWDDRASTNADLKEVTYNTYGEDAIAVENFDKDVTEYNISTESVMGLEFDVSVDFPAATVSNIATTTSLVGTMPAVTKVVTVTAEDKVTTKDYTFNFVSTTPLEPDTVYNLKNYDPYTYSARIDRGKPTDAGTEGETREYQDKGDRYVYKTDDSNRDGWYNNFYADPFASVLGISVSDGSVVNGAAEDDNSACYEHLNSGKHINKGSSLIFQGATFLRRLQSDANQNFKTVWTYTNGEWVQTAYYGSGYQPFYDADYSGQNGADPWFSFVVSSPCTVYVERRELSGDTWVYGEADNWQNNNSILLGNVGVYYKHYNAGDTVKIPNFGGQTHAKKNIFEGEKDGLIYEPNMYAIVWDSSLVGPSLDSLTYSADDGEEVTVTGFTTTDNGEKVYDVVLDADVDKVVVNAAAAKGLTLDNASAELDLSKVDSGSVVFTLTKENGVSSTFTVNFTQEKKILADTIYDLKLNGTEYYYVSNPPNDSAKYDEEGNAIVYDGVKGTGTMAGVYTKGNVEGYPSYYVAGADKNNASTINGTTGSVIVEDNLIVGKTRRYSDSTKIVDKTSDYFAGETIIRQSQTSLNKAVDAKLSWNATFSDGKGGWEQKPITLGSNGQQYYGGADFSGKDGAPYWMEFVVSSGATVFMSTAYSTIWTNAPDDWTKNTTSSLQLRGTSAIYYKHYNAGELVQLPNYGNVDELNNGIAYDPPIYVVVWDSSNKVNPDTLSRDNSIKSIKYGDEEIAVVAGQTEYAIYNTGVADLVVEANDAKATVDTASQSIAADGKYTVTITAEHGEKQTYTFTFRTKSSDASIKSAKYGDVEFDLSAESYFAYYVAGTALEIEKSSEYATVDVPAITGDGEYTVTVTAEDGTKAEYTFTFRTISADASIGSITYGGADVEVVEGGTVYTVEFEAGADLVVTANSEYAKVSKVEVTVAGEYVVTVTAENGEVKEYTFNVIPPQVKLTVNVEGDGTVTDAEGKVYSFDNKAFDLNTAFELTAKALKGYKFAYWLDMDSGRIVSEEATYSFTLVSDKKLEAVFNEESDTVKTVIFRNKNGRIVRPEVGGDGTVEVPTDPDYMGYNFKGWKLNGELTEYVAGNKIKYADLGDASEIVFDAYYTKKVDLYKAQVTDGTIAPEAADGYEYDTKLTVTANAADEGKKFSHWIKDSDNADEKIVSYDESYSFFMGARDTTVTAIFVEEDVEVTKAPVIVMTEPAVLSGEGKIAFFAERNLYADEENGRELIETGILVNLEKKVFEMGKDGTLKATSTSKAGKGQFTVRKANLKANDTVYAMAYITYKDAHGIHTEFSNVVTGIYN